MSTQNQRAVHIAPDLVAATAYTYEHRKTAEVLRADGSVRMRTLPAPASPRPRPRVTSLNCSPHTSRLVHDEYMERNPGMRLLMLICCPCLTIALLGAADVFSGVNVPAWFIGGMLAWAVDVAVGGWTFTRRAT